MLHATVHYVGTTTLMLANGDATAATRNGVGQYGVTFPQNLNGCSGVVAAGVGSSSTADGAVFRSDVTWDVRIAGQLVQLRARSVTSEAFSDTSFHLIVVC